jgi:hypothetical protein
MKSGGEREEPVVRWTGPMSAIAIGTLAPYVKGNKAHTKLSEAYAISPAAAQAQRTDHVN